MSFFKSVFKPRHHHEDEQNSSSYYDAPPQWSAAPEKSHKHGLYHEAKDKDYKSAEEFCNTYPLDSPRPVPSNAIDRIKSDGARAWGIELPESIVRFKGYIQNICEGAKASGVVKIVTEKGCKDVCLLSTLPMVAGMYDPFGKEGFYFEVKVLKMKETVAIGTACRPYPLWRLPGWNRQSAALHLDDMRKFFEDPDGGKDYTPSLLPSQLVPGTTIGCAFTFTTGSIFYTYNGQPLPTAFTGIYLPRSHFDVFAAIGVCGEAELEVNFGGELFRWAPGNEWQWRVEGLAGQMEDPASRFGESLPAYCDATRAT